MVETAHLTQDRLADAHLGLQLEWDRQVADFGLLPRHRR